jgi:hypothetical protein
MIAEENKMDNEHSLPSPPIIEYAETAAKIYLDLQRRHRQGLYSVYATAYRIAGILLSSPEEFQHLEEHERWGDRKPNIKNIQHFVLEFVLGDNDYRELAGVLEDLRRKRIHWKNVPQRLADGGGYEVLYRQIRPRAQPHLQRGRR